MFTIYSGITILCITTFILLYSSSKQTSCYRTVSNMLYLMYSICLELLSLLLYSCVYKYLYTCLSFVLLPSIPCIGLILFCSLINKFLLISYFSFNSMDTTPQTTPPPPPSADEPPPPALPLEDGRRGRRGRGDDRRDGRGRRRRERGKEQRSRGRGGGGRRAR